MDYDDIKMLELYKKQQDELDSEKKEIWDPVWQKRLQDREWLEKDNEEPISRNWVLEDTTDPEFERQYRVNRDKWQPIWLRLHQETKNEHGYGSAWFSTHVKVSIQVKPQAYQSHFFSWMQNRQEKWEFQRQQKRVQDLRLDLQRSIDGQQEHRTKAKDLHLELQAARTELLKLEQAQKKNQDYVDYLEVKEVQSLSKLNQYDPFKVGNRRRYLKYIEDHAKDLKSGQ